MSIVNSLALQMSSATASLKLLAQGSGTFSVPSTSTNVTRTSVVFHGYGNDNLIWQVGINSPELGINIITPWASSDGQTILVSTLDSNNLTVTGKAQTAGTPTLAYTVNYYYRILIP